MADLRPAEVKLWKAVVAGAPCEFSRSEPRIIGAAYLRFLLLGGDGDGSAHLNPIDVKGARIEGVLDLDECEAKRSMKAEACRFEGGMMLNDASLRNFGLIGCFVKPIVGVPGLFARPTAIFAERLKASGSVYFRQGSRIFGAVALRHAKIDGSLDLCGSVFSPGTGGRAIDLTGAGVGGDLRLHGLYRGGVPDASQTRAPVRWFRSEGAILLDHAEVGKDLYIVGADMRLAARARPAVDDVVLQGRGLTVKGGLFLHGGARVEGISLLGARVGVLIDRLECWQFGAGRHRFDGFVYDRIADESRFDRAAWLRTQRPRDLGEDQRRLGGAAASDPNGLRRQPWLQAAKALEDGGAKKKATELRIALERQTTRTGNLFRQVWGNLYDALAAYGFRPGQLVLVTFGVWLVGAWAAHQIARHGDFVATKDKPSPAFQAQLAQCWRRAPPKPPVDWRIATGFCDELLAPDYPAIYPWLYSVDVLVPALATGQTKAWQWRQHGGWRWILFLEAAYGYVAATALVGMIGAYIIRKSN